MGCPSFSGTSSSSGPSKWVHIVFELVFRLNAVILTPKLVQPLYISAFDGHIHFCMDEMINTTSMMHTLANKHAQVSVLINFCACLLVCMFSCYTDFSKGSKILTVFGITAIELCVSRTITIFYNQNAVNICCGLGCLTPK